MNKKLILILTFFLAINTVSALEINIDIKPTFNVGDAISFNYTLISDTSLEITYLPHVVCENAPTALLEEKTIDLQAGQSYTKIYSSISIDNSIEPQSCTAYVQILNPAEQSQIVSKNFSIITDPSFSFNILTCKDQSCSEKSKVFVKSEDIFIDFDSEVESPSITATLTLSDETSSTIQLPYNFKASQTGTYTLDVSASKESFKTMEKKTQFAVIAKQAEIKEVDLETLKSQKPKPDEPDQPPKKPSEFFNTALLVLLVVVILISIFYLIVKKRTRR